MNEDVEKLLEEAIGLIETNQNDEAISTIMDAIYSLNVLHENVGEYLSLIQTKCRDYNFGSYTPCFQETFDDITDTIKNIKESLNIKNR